MTATILLSLIVVAGASGWLIREARHNPAMYLTLLVAFQAVTQQVSVIYLDHAQSYIIESATLSYPTWAWLRLLGYQALFFAVCAAVCRALRRTSQATLEPQLRLADPALLRAAMWILAGILALQYLNFALSPGLPVASSTVNRWNYWTTYAPWPWLPRLFGVLMVFMPLVISLVCVNLIRRRAWKQLGFALGLGGLYLGYLLLSGQRFNGINVAMLLVIGVVMALGDPRYVRRRERIGGVILTGMFAMLLVYGWYEMSFRRIADYAGGAAQALVYRILVLTGHVYWNTDNFVMHGGAQWGGLEAFAEGMRTLQLAIGGPEAYAFLDAGINYTNGFPAIAVLQMGYWGAIPVVALLGALLGAACHLTYHALKAGWVLRAFPVAYILFWLQATYTSGDLGFLMDWKLLIFVLAVLLPEVLPRRSVAHEAPKHQPPDDQAIGSSAGGHAPGLEP